MSMTSTIRPIRTETSTPEAYQARSGPKRTGLLDQLILWLERRRQRDALADRIDDKRLLEDIGLTRDQVLREVSKPFWR